MSEPYSMKTFQREKYDFEVERPHWIKPKAVFFIALTISGILTFLGFHIYGIDELVPSEKSSLVAQDDIDLAANDQRSTSEQRPEILEFYGTLCFPLIIACASFCVTLSSRITSSSQKLRQLCNNIQAESDKKFGQHEEENYYLSLARNTVLMRQIELLHIRYMLARMSMTSKVLGIILFVSMLVLAKLHLYYPAFLSLQAGLSILLTGLGISVLDIMTSRDSLEREIEFTQFVYSRKLNKFAPIGSDDRKRWIAAEFPEKLRILKLLPLSPSVQPKDIGNS